MSEHSRCSAVVRVILKGLRKPTRNSHAKYFRSDSIPDSTSYIEVIQAKDLFIIAVDTVKELN